MMLTIGCFCQRSAAHAHPLDHPIFRAGYAKIARRITDRGAKFVFVRGKESYLGGTTFSHGWWWDGETLTADDTPITVDLIYKKGSIPLTADAEMRIINHPILAEFYTDKMNIRERWPTHTPASAVIATPEQWQAWLAAHQPDELIVTKPQNGSCGKNVLIQSRTTYESTEISFPFLAQEYLDTTGGIPGWNRPTPFGHDFRLVIANGEIIYALIRLPTNDSRVSNLCRNGVGYTLPLDRIPPAARTFAAMIDAELPYRGPRLYSIDMGFKRDGTINIIEMNAQPGMPLVDSPESDAYLRSIADFLVDTAILLTAHV